MIKCEHVTKIYKDTVVALDDCNLEIGKGEFVFMVGPTGSGKSTLLRLLLREEEPTRGEIFVAGKNIGHLSPWKVPMLRRNIGTVFQDFKLLPDKTVFSNVAFALEVIGKQSQGPLAQVAQQAQPTVQQHLDQAKQLMKQLGGPPSATAQRPESTRTE